MSCSHYEGSVLKRQRTNEQQNGCRLQLGERKETNTLEKSVYC